jgi:hypothetical protein
LSGARAVRDKESKGTAGEYLSVYLLDEDKIDSYRKYFANSPYTVFREEKDENGIINELNKIDECFVNDDAKGIAEIMDRAKANDKLSNWTKQLIIHECKTALLELCI